MTRFQCDTCKVIFETEGTVKEYHSPVYGPCSKRIAICTECGEPCDEYRAPKRSKPAPALPCQQAMATMGGCPAGGGCCAGS